MGAGYSGQGRVTGFVGTWDGDLPRQSDAGFPGSSKHCQNYASQVEEREGHCYLGYMVQDSNCGGFKELSFKLNQPLYPQ